MKVRNLLALSAVFAAAITFAAVTFVGWMGVASDRAEAEQQRSRSVARSAYALLVSTYQHARAKSLPSAQDWRDKHRAVQEALSPINAELSEEEQALTDRAAQLHRDFDTLSSQLASSSDGDLDAYGLDTLITSTQILTDSIFSWARRKGQFQATAAHAFQRSAIGAIAVVATLLFAQGVLVARRLLQPLKRLDELTDEVEAGKTPRLMSQGRRDEIAQLELRFNAMATAIAARDEALHQEVSRRQESERLIKTIADHIPGLVAYISNDQRYVFANEKFRPAFGKAPEDFIGRTMREMLGDAIYSSVKPHIELALSGQSVQFERHTTELGRDSHHLVEYIPNRLADGSVEGFFALVLDITERKKAELQYARNEERIRSILTNAPDAFLAADATGNITEWNAQAERTFGWTRGEAIGMPMSSLWQATATREARVVAVHSFGGRIETVAVNKHGRPIPVELSVASVPDGDGFSTIAFLHDITERKQSDDALRETQSSLAITGNLAGVGGWGLDLAANAMSWTDIVRDIHEVAPDFEPTPVQAFDFVEPGHQHSLIAALQQGIESGTRWHIEVPIRTAKQNQRWVRIVGDTEYDLDGEPVRVVGALQDISERKALALAFQAKEQFIRGITDSVPARIGYIDQLGRYQFVNEAYCKRFGRSREAILGKTRAELLGSKEDSAIAHYRARAFSGESQRFEAEESVEGTVHYIDSQLVPDFDEHGSVRGLFKIGIDITERKAAEVALRELTDIFDHTPDFIVQADWKGRLVYMNPAVREAVGLGLSDDVSTHEFSEFYTLETTQLMLDIAAPYARDHGVWLGENKAVLKGGRIVPVSHMVLAHKDEKGRVTRYSSVMRDISSEVHSRDLLHRQTETLSSIAEAIPSVVAAVGPDDTYRFVNSAFERWRGRPRSDILGRHIREVLGELEYAVSLPYIRRALNGETATFERDSFYGNAPHNQLVSYIPLRLPSGEVDGFVGVAQDITAHKQEELRLLRLSERDPLTGVLNRQGFETYLEQRHDKHEEGCALLYIDLDRFKPVNDTYGHPMGDALLKAFAERLQTLVRPTDVVARLGGDEFAIVLPGIKNKANAEAVADKVVTAAATTFKIGQLELHVGASVGVALAQDDGWDGLVRRADAAVYVAKGRGRGQRA